MSSQVPIARPGRNRSDNTTLLQGSPDNAAANYRIASIVRRRLPPYGRIVDAILRNPDRLVKFSGCTRNRGSIWLLTGRDAWDLAAARPRHLNLVLPEGEDPENFRWDFLRGHDPILLDGVDAQNPDQRRIIAVALFRDGVNQVLAGRVLMERKS